MIDMVFRPTQNFVRRISFLSAKKLMNDQGTIHGQISFDLAMNDDMGFIEGAYRIGGNTEWQVFVTLRRDDSMPFIRQARWDSGVTGVNIFIPRSARLNGAMVQDLLGQHYKVCKWMVVRGPDSMELR